MADEDPTLSKVVSEDLLAEKRYDLIEEIEDTLAHITSCQDVRVMTYLAQDPMDSGDVKAFEDMLQAVDSPEYLYLFINSPGGDPETALRIINMCRARSGHFRTVIPDMAKSAATQVCIGSEKICMGYNSELGPIDPQIRFQGGWTAAYTIKEGLEFIESRAKENQDVPTQIYSAIAQHYSPAKLKEAEKAIQYIRDEATEIAGYMFDDEEDAEECVKTLLEKIPHDKAIPIDNAMDMGINVLDMREYPELWSTVWELYIRSDVMMGEENCMKLWETKSHTIAIESGNQTNP